jgi:hypothetical protein
MKKVALILFALGSLIPALAFAHGGHKHVIGTVSSVASKILVVKTSTGNVSVPISNTTRFYHGRGTQQEATAAEVQKGMRVVVHLGADGKAVEVHIPEMKTTPR